MRVGSGHTLLLYSLPGSQGFYAAHQHDFGSGTQHLDAPSISVRPFESNLSPIRFRIDEHRLVDPDRFTIQFKPAPSLIEWETTEYENTVKRAAASCRHDREKIVISRSKMVLINTDRWSHWLRSLRQAFPRAFVYLLASETYGHWMGATPELLVEKNANGWHTVALAGTARDGDFFGNKERLEQAVVEQQLEQKLSPRELEKEAVSEVAYGQVRHLISHLRWQGRDRFEAITELLHPTAAVCGHPTAKAMAFIEENERRPRGLYTGYLALNFSTDQHYAFVNLRCAQLFRDRIWLHAGGGVNRYSNARAEWDETELKMEVFLKVLRGE